MVIRKYWIKRLEQLWKERSVVWLSGVRRAGKTFLCRSLRDVEYYDCELPRIRRQLEDPESFLDSLKGKRIVLDEIHRMGNPAELLKIAADHYPSVKVVATGSSTLGASRKFKDTLTGRKAELWLTPMLASDLKDFKNDDLGHRFIRGGLPPFFMAKKMVERDFQEWVDAYWSKDIQELFRLERRHSFQRFAELLFEQSGGIFEASSFSGPCEVSRTTISNYLSVLEATFVVHVIRPFNRHRPTEIVAAPRVYGFDTGFVCYHRGWGNLRQDDMGGLWEHFVLNEMHGCLQTRDILYWRDKQRHEVDFVLRKAGPFDGLRAGPSTLLRAGGATTAIECKWSGNSFEPDNLQAFRRHYPKGENLVVSHDTDRSFSRKYGDLKVTFVSLEGLIRKLGGMKGRG